MRSTLGSVRETAAALHEALLLPADDAAETMNAQIPALQEAAAALEALATLPRWQGEPMESESLTELEAVAKELLASKKLIAQGLAVTQGLARLLTPAAEYRPDGEPAPARTSGTVLLRG